MNTIHCIIVDDEQNAIDLLTEYLQATGLLHLAYATTSPLDALQFVRQQPVQLAFLDIDMPYMSGIELAKVLQDQCMVIFTTGYSEFVSDSYELNAIDYLLKPIALPRFMRAVQQVINRIAPHGALPLPILPMGEADSIDHDYIYVKTGPQGAIKAIMLNEIDYIEGKQKYVTIHHCGYKTMALLSVKAILEKLPAAFFMRVHKSYIVSMLKIVKVEGSRLWLEDIPTEIPIGEAFRPSFAAAMKERLAR